MRISIAERYRPFSHLPGTFLLLPGSGLPIQIFPCLLRIFSPVEGKLLSEISLSFKGPVDQFTIVEDLEKGRNTISGYTQTGWMRYHLIASKDLSGIRMAIDKAPTGTFSVQNKNQQYILRDGEWLEILQPNSSFEPYQIPPCERLSFGCHKAQDWDLVRRRGKLEEILPFWHRLGQLVPQHSMPEFGAGRSLIEECKEQFSVGNGDAAMKSWRKLFLVAFKGILVPRPEDCDYQGIIESGATVSSNIAPLAILSVGARLIRDLFVQLEDRQLSILPLLLPCFPFGKLIDVSLPSVGTLSMEWSKKWIRRLMIKADGEGELSLNFRSGIKSYRLRYSEVDKGERKACTETFHYQKNCTYLLDNFL